MATVEVKPVSKAWLRHKSLQLKLFPMQVTGFRWLPVRKIGPEHMVQNVVFLPEHMLSVLASGGWVGEWKPRVRIIIANRLKHFRDYPGFFTEVWSEVADTLLNVQLTGGTLAERAKLREKVRWSKMHPEATRQDRVLAKLAECLMKDTDWDALMYPLWWIRVILAHTDVLPAFGWCKARKEQKVQKLVILKIIQSPVPPGVF